MSIPPVTSMNSSSTKSREELVCPITLTPFDRPWILLEDGFTYEKSAIEQWLKLKPNRSPIIGEIPSATLLPNCTISRGRLICPITEQPFQEPYYCVEDGFTYEKSAILKRFEVEVQKSLEQKVSFPSVVNPISGAVLRSLTLYPNKILFNKGIPKEQKPTIHKIEINDILADYLKNESQEVKCIFDSEIRELIERYATEKDAEKKKDLKRQIDERRVHLGLNVQETFFKNLDLSHLNLSKMNLEGLQQKCSIFKKTDLSDSILKNCNFSRCRFLDCNMQRTFFINCSFIGEEVSFFRTDMKGVTIEGPCSLEKGSSWHRITNRGDFIAELSTRGAINVDSVTIVNL